MEADQWETSKFGEIVDENQNVLLIFLFTKGMFKINN